MVQGVRTEPRAQRTTSGVRRKRRVRAVASLGLGLLAVASWWFGTVHPGTHLSSASGVVLCLGRASVDEQDIVVGQLEFRAPDDVEVLSVALVDPVNLTLADARVVSADRVGDPTDPILAFGVARGWPLTEGQRAEYALDWSTERDLVGAHLAAGVTEAPILHLDVTDPSLDASYQAWQVVYRMNGTRWASTFTHALRVPGAVGPCGE